MNKFYLTHSHLNCPQTPVWFYVSCVLLVMLERFSYDLEMKTREQNRNNKRTEIERFDWFIERIQTRVALVG